MGISITPCGKTHTDKLEGETILSKKAQYLRGLKIHAYMYPS